MRDDAGQGGRAGSPVSSTDDALARANGMPGLPPAQAQAQDSATSKNSLPKSASTSHLGGLSQMPPGPMVQPPIFHLNSSNVDRHKGQMRPEKTGTVCITVLICERWLDCTP